MTTNVNRLCGDGHRYSDEVVNKSQIYITTAGWKNSFAYDKLIELLIQSIIDPDEVMIMGGTYKTPVVEGLLDENFVDQLRAAGTYNDESFEREYESKWSGDVQNAFFSADKFERCRILMLPEYEYSAKSSKSAYYVLGVDVGRLSDQTEICVIKSTPQVQGADIKSLVNLYSFEKEDFEAQSIHIKRLFYKYHARVVSVDANGLGVGLIDFLTKPQTDPETGQVLPPFGVEGGTSEEAVEPYKKIKGGDVEEDALFLIKANAPINTEAYSYLQTQMSSGKIKFLIDEQRAKTNFLTTAKGQKASAAERNDYLRPYQLTSILKDQLLNLVEDNEGVNIILKRSNKNIKKDKVSAIAYGMYYIKKQEDKRRKNKHRSIADFMFFS